MILEHEHETSTGVKVQEKWFVKNGTLLSIESAPTIPITHIELDVVLTNEADIINPTVRPVDKEELS